MAALEDVVAAKDAEMALNAELRLQLHGEKEAHQQTKNELAQLKVREFEFVSPTICLTHASYTFHYFFFFTLGK